MRKRLNQRRSNRKKRRIEKRNTINKTILLLTYYLSFSIYLIWRFYYTIPRMDGYLSIIFGYILFIAEVVGFVESSIFYLTLWDTYTPKTPDVHDKEFPEVDVFIATYNESNDLLYKTLIACKNMDYPDKNKVHIYVCDDGNREELKGLCEKININYITRSENTHAKAGNLNNALKQTSSPYVVTFDADMIPMHDFLTKTIPFFMTDEKIGFVQVPQNFYNPDLFQYNLFNERNMPNEQNLFSRLIQAGKSRFNAVIYAGSNTVILREALDKINGLVVGTITEDFATGMMIQSKGYKCIYLNEIHASGLSPESLEDLFNQRIRWGRGVIQTFKEFNPVFMRGLSIFQKVMYFSAFSYWYFGVWRFIFIMAPILFSVFGIVVLSASAIQMLEIWMPMFIITNLSFIYFSNATRTSSWSHIYDTILFPQITKGVLKETFGFKMSKFKVTPKDNIKRSEFINRFGLIKVQLFLALLSLVGIVRIVYLYINDNFQFQYIINLFWLFYNFYLLIMAIFFASERPKFRSSERVVVYEDAYIISNEKIFSGKTADISETGISIKLKEPIFLELDERHKIKVNTSRNESKFLAKLIRVDSLNKSYKYVFHIEEIDEENFSELLLIIYDRVPPFPEKIKGNNIFYNVVNNIKNRRKRIISFNRKLPRINIDKDVKVILNQNECIVVHILDFNYEYISIKKTNIVYQEFFIQLDEDVDINIQCVYDEKLSRYNKKDVFIYKMINFKEYVNYDVVSILKSDMKYYHESIGGIEIFE